MQLEQAIEEVINALCVRRNYCDEEFRPGDLVSYHRDGGELICRVYERIQYIEGDHDGNLEAILILSDSLDSACLFWPLHVLRKAGATIQLIEKNTDHDKVWRQEY